jgi:hypothetical protein
VAVAQQATRSHRLRRREFIGEVNTCAAAGSFAGATQYHRMSVMAAKCLAGADLWSAEGNWNALCRSISINTGADLFQDVSAVGAHMPTQNKPPINSVYCNVLFNAELERPMGIVCRISHLVARLSERWEADRAPSEGVASYRRKSSRPPDHRPSIL